MIRSQTTMAVGLCLFALLSATAQTNGPIMLPADPSAAVITLDDRGGIPVRILNPNPPLTIRADGTVVVTDPAGVREDWQGKLSQAELQELLKFVIQDNDFFGIESGDIWTAIRAEEVRAGRGVRIADAGEPVIRVKTAEKEKELRFNGLGFYAERYPLNLFPSMKVLDRLNAVVSRLSSIPGEVRAGGKTGIAAALADANAYLARMKPDLPQFTADDYLGATLSPTGWSMRFAREAGGGTRSAVTVQYHPGQQTEFRFSVIYPSASSVFGTAR